MLTASWFVSVFYGYSCHRQPPQFLIIFYGMCFPSYWIPQPLFPSKDIFHWEEKKHCFGTPSLEILLYNYLLVTTAKCESPLQVFNLLCQLICSILYAQLGSYACSSWLRLLSSVFKELIYSFYCIHNANLSLLHSSVLNTGFVLCRFDCTPCPGSPLIL